MKSLGCLLQVILSNGPQSEPPGVQPGVVLNTGAGHMKWDQKIPLSTGN